MFFPLANDENGHPLEVPATAAGWLVRRHGGQKGRPAAVFDGDGRPLVVEMAATARDLRDRGCEPGPYRLEAVDLDRRPLGIVAFTEVAEAEGGVVEERRRQHPDAAIEALARAVEAMQRVQMERERVQADVMIKLVERLAPPPPQPVSDLRSSLQQVAEVQKALRRLADSPPATQPQVVSEPAETQQEDGQESSTMTDRLLSQLLREGMPIIKQVVLSKLGLRPEQIAGLTGSPATPASGATPSAPPPKPASSSEGGEASQAPAAEDGGTPASEVKAKLDAVLALLDPEERKKVLTAITSLSDSMLETAQAQLLRLTAEEAVKLLRTSFLGATAAGAATGAG